MFNAGLRRSVHGHRKAVRCIGASREPRVSMFRRDWRTKTGVSVKLPGPLRLPKSFAALGERRPAKADNHELVLSRADVAHCYKLDEEASARPLMKLTSGRRRLTNDGTKSVRLGPRAGISCSRHRREPASPENGASTRWRRFRRLLWYRIRS